MTHRRRLLALLALYLLIAWGYGAVTPLFEAPDEQHHYHAALTIARTGRLPSALNAGLARQEAAQPPLYYLLSALLIAPLETGQLPLWPNPHANLVQTRATANLNAFVHTAAEAWPWRGDALAVHLLRAVNALFGLGTLLCLYGSGLLLWPAAPERALVAAALVAFLPQFGFLHGAVNNDGLIIFLCSAALWQLLRLWTGPLTSRRLLLLGVTIGCALLTKMSGALLLPLAFLVLALRARQDGRFTHLPRQLLRLTLPVLLLAGWLLWRNWRLYGDPTAANQFVALAGGDRSYSLLAVWSDRYRVWRSTFALFGWMNVYPPPWIHAAWNAIVLAGIAGSFAAGLRALRARRRPRLLPLLWLAAWCLLVFAAWLQFMLQTPADQGRLLFPALLPLALGLSAGLAGLGSLLPGRLAALPGRLTALLALGTTLASLGVVIPAAYALPALRPADAVPASANRLYEEMGQGLVLVAGETAVHSIVPGERLPVTLYWQAAAPPANAPLVSIKLFGQDGAVIADQLAYHGRGLFPTTLWPAGDTLVVEQASLLVDPLAATPAQARLVVSLADAAHSVQAATVRLVPHRWPPAVRQPAATLGAGIELAAASLGAETAVPGATVVVTLTWQITAPPGQALTTFVHLGDPTRPPLAQADGPPLDGDFPSTAWQAGDRFTEAAALALPADLPAGRYPIQVGLYDSLTGARLPLWIDGARQPQDAYPVGWLTVTR